MHVQKQAPEFTEGMGWGRCWDLSHCVPSRAATAITAITSMAEGVVMWEKGLSSPRGGAAPLKAVF